MISTSVYPIARSNNSWGNRVAGIFAAGLTQLFNTRSTTLLATGLAALLAGGFVSAATLPAPDSPAVAHGAYITVAAADQSSAITVLSTRGSLLETGIGAFTSSTENRHSGAALDIKASQFSSLEATHFVPAGGALEPGQSQDKQTPAPQTPANGAASMPLVALAWLFGIGVIGMGTVGRRRKQP